jgi:hypothetical protein
VPSPITQRKRNPVSGGGRIVRVAAEGGRVLVGYDYGEGFVGDDGGKLDASSHWEAFS